MSFFAKSRSSLSGQNDSRINRKRRRKRTQSLRTRRCEMEHLQKRELMAVDAFGNSWQNPVDQHDVTGDGQITALDALTVLNHLPQLTGTDRTSIQGARPSDKPFLDVNGDRQISAGDALRVINQLAKQTDLGTNKPLDLEDDAEREANDETQSLLGQRFELTNGTLRKFSSTGDVGRTVMEGVGRFHVMDQRGRFHTIARTSDQRLVELIDGESSAQPLGPGIYYRGDEILVVAADTDTEVNISRDGNRLTVSMSWETSGPIALHASDVSVADLRSKPIDHIVVFGSPKKDEVVNESDIAMTVYGGEGDDRIFGGSAADQLFGEGGADVIVGGDGADKLVGGDGNDFLEGGSGRDRIFGGLGGDQIEGGEGADWLYGGLGADWIEGGDGNDKIFTGGGSLFQDEDDRSVSILVRDGKIVDRFRMVSLEQGTFPILRNGQPIPNPTESQLPVLLGDGLMHSVTIGDTTYLRSGGVIFEYGPEGQTLHSITGENIRFEFEIRGGVHANHLPVNERQLIRNRQRQDIIPSELVRNDHIQGDAGNDTIDGYTERVAGKSLPVLDIAYHFWKEDMVQAHVDDYGFVDYQDARTTRYTSLGDAHFHTAIALIIAAFEGDHDNAGRYLDAFLNYGFAENGEPIRHPLRAEKEYKGDGFILQLAGIHFAWKYGNLTVRGKAKELMQKWVDVLDRYEGQLGNDQDFDNNPFGKEGLTFDGVIGVTRLTYPWLVEDIADEMRIPYSATIGFADASSTLAGFLRDIIVDQVRWGLNEFKFEFNTWNPTPDNPFGVRKETLRLPSILVDSIADRVRIALLPLDTAQMLARIPGILDFALDQNFEIGGFNVTRELQDFIHDILGFALGASGIQPLLLLANYDINAKNFDSQEPEEAFGNHLFFWETVLFEEYNSRLEDVLHAIPLTVKSRKLSMMESAEIHNWHHWFAQYATDLGLGVEEAQMWLYGRHERYRRVDYLFQRSTTDQDNQIEAWDDKTKAPKIAPAQDWLLLYHLLSRKQKLIPLGV